MCSVKGCEYPKGACKLLQDASTGEIDIKLKPTGKKVVARAGNVELTEHSFTLRNAYGDCQLQKEQLLGAGTKQLPPGENNLLT